jgi:NADPH-dependent ferric siderophore reductase
MAVPSYHAVVARTRAITSRLQRVTIGGPGLAGFTSRGLPDERVKLLLPAPGQERPELPTVTERGFGFAPGVQRPTMRSFTLRRFDPQTLELDLDFVAHDGLASAWSRTVAPGAKVGITGPAGGYDPGEEERRQLLVGDETALPAIATILERLPASAHADVFAEVADASAEVPLPTSNGARITWLHRDSSAEPVGALLVDAVRALDWPAEPVHVWAAGETSAMRAIRRHLREEHRVPRERLEVIGHWRERLTSDEANMARNEAVQAALAAGAGDDELDELGL